MLKKPGSRREQPGYKILFTGISELTYQEAKLYPKKKISNEHGYSSSGLDRPRPLKKSVINN